MKHYHDKGLLGWLDGRMTPPPPPRIILDKQSGSKQCDTDKIVSLPLPFFLNTHTHTHTHTQTLIGILPCCFYLQNLFSFSYSFFQSLSIQISKIYSLPSVSSGNHSERKMQNQTSKNVTIFLCSPFAITSSLSFPGFLYNTSLCVSPSDSSCPEQDCSAQVSYISGHSC